MSSTSALNSLLSSTASANGSGLNLSSLLTAATGATSTGIDVSSAVDAAIYAAQAPERQWQSEQSTIQTRITALTSLQSAANAISADLDNFTDPLGALASRTVTSSNGASVSATATPGAIPGTHSVGVSQLATAASWYSSAIANANATLGTSSLTITEANGMSSTFDLGANGNNSLSSLVQSINAAGLKVTASIVQDASGARLALVGSGTGDGADFTVADGSSTAATWTSATFASASAVLDAGSFQISDGSSSTNIGVSSGATLSQLASQINNAGLNLSASVITDGTGTRLSIYSTVGGQVTMSTDPTLTLKQASQAQNAKLTVDGVPVSSSSNTVTGALDGITLSLTGVTAAASPTTLSVTADSKSITDALSNFVSDYNSAITSLSGQFTFSSATGSQGVLGSDSVVRSLQSTLLASASLSAGSGSLSTLSGLGITMQDDGTLELNTTELDQVIAKSPGTIEDFFQGTPSGGFANQMQTQLKAFTQLSSGSLAVDISNLTQQYNQLQSNVDDFESGYIASQRTLLTAMYSKAEIALQSLPNTLKQIQAELNNNSGS